MNTTMSVNQFETQDSCLDMEFEAEAGDSVLETFEFLGAAGFGRDGTRSLAVDLIELS